MSKEENIKGYSFSELMREVGIPEETIPRDGDTYGEASRLSSSPVGASGSMTVAVEEPVQKGTSKAAPRPTDDPDFVLACGTAALRPGTLAVLAGASLVAVALAFRLIRR